MIKKVIVLSYTHTVTHTHTDAHTQRTSCTTRATKVVGQYATANAIMPTWTETTAGDVILTIS